MTTWVVVFEFLVQDPEVALPLASVALAEPVEQFCVFEFILLISFVVPSSGAIVVVVVTEVAVGTRTTAGALVGGEATSL